ncbi:MAG: hypothetical protein ACI9VI_001398, partial [Candidatus Azotimanducaceae bacterium]
SEKPDENADKNLGDGSQPSGPVGGPAGEH